MRFKTSCFNPTLCRNFLRRFWPLALVVLGTVLLALGLPLAGQLQDHLSGLNLLSSVYSTAQIMVILEAAAALLAAALVFHHLHSRREIQFFQALPLKRRSCYLTAYLTGFGLLAAPMLLGIGVCMIIVAAGGLGFAVPALLKLYGAGIAALLLFYSMAVAACCLAGQTFGAVLIYVGMHCAVYIILFCAGNIASTFMAGIDFSNFLIRPRQWLTPLPHLINATVPCFTSVPAESLHLTGPYATDESGMVQVITGFASSGTIVIYGVVGAVLAVLSGVLYQIRPSETAGEMVSFGPVRLLCKIFGALVVCVAGALLFLASGLFTEEIPFAAVVLSVLGFGAVGWFAAEMVVQKTLRVFGKQHLTACGALLLTLLLLLGGAKLDLLGIVRHVPDAGDVASVEVNYNYGAAVAVTPQEAAELHQLVLDKPMYLTNNTFMGPNISLQFAYTLKNGHKIYREYHVQYTHNGIVQAAQALLEQPEYCYQTWFGILEDGVSPDNFQNGSISSYMQSFSESYTPFLSNADPEWREDYMNLTASQAVAIYGAICQDIADGNIIPDGFQNQVAMDALGSIDFECYVKDYDPSMGTYAQYVEDTLTTYTQVDLYWSMEHTIACLEEMGFEFAGR